MSRSLNWGDQGTAWDEHIFFNEDEETLKQQKQQNEREAKYSADTGH